MRLARGPLRGAGVRLSLVVHVLGWALLLIGVWLIDMSLLDYEIVDDLAWEFDHDARNASLLFGIWFVIIEAGFVLFAWMTACWGAGVEPFKASMERSLSRWYQLTPWLALIVLGVMMSLIYIEKVEMWYYDNYHWGRYGDYYDDHNEPMWLLQGDRLRTLIMIGRFSTLGIANLIGLWWILATVFVHRNNPTWFASCRWPAVCEGCGYALAGLTDEQGCPECGKKVGDSKPGPRWHERQRSLRLLIRGLFRPSTVGTAMPTRRPRKEPARVLVWGLLFTVLAGPIMMLLIDLGQRIDGYAEVDDFGEALEFYFAGGFMAGTYAALLGGLLLLGAGSLVGTIIRLFGKRNIMPGAMSAACYSAGLLPLWVLATGVQMLILIPLAEYLYDTNRSSLVDFFPFLIFAMHGLILIYVVLHVARISKASRYANV